jgi:hypothetical protein
VLLVEGGTLKEARFFSQESRMNIEDLERERNELKLWISKCILIFFEWPTEEAGGDLYITPTSKEPLEESFTGQVQWTSLEAGRNFLEVGPEPDKSGSPD